MLKNFLQAVGGGVCLGIGGTAVLSVDNDVLGMFLFFAALTSIYFFGFGLFTGKAGYIPLRPVGYVLEEVIPTWCGNFAGTFLFAQAMLCTAYRDRLQSLAAKLVVQKCQGGVLSCIILAALCGLLVYFAVDMYHRYRENHLMAALAYSFICVMAFQACHFEHSIADMFFFSITGKVKTHLSYLLLFTLGNLLGCAVKPFCEKYTKRILCSLNGECPNE